MKRNIQMYVLFRIFNVIQNFVQNVDSVYGGNVNCTRKTGSLLEKIIIYFEDLVEDVAS